MLPEAEDVDIIIDNNDLEITVCRASGPGGQGVNTTDSAVQILYKPTGMIVQCADERSQLKNKTRAMKVLRSRLLQAKQEEERPEVRGPPSCKSVLATEVSEFVPTISSESITDHRIGYTTHNLDGVLDGELVISWITCKLQTTKLRFRHLWKSRVS